MTRIATPLAVALAALAGPAAAMTLRSADIRPDGPIATPYINARCGGGDLSPALSWSGAPSATRSLVLTMIDLDVKPAGFSHWIVVDLPPTTSGLPRGTKSLPPPARAITGDFGEAGYQGPCPPRGSGVHHYRFTIWAMPTAGAATTPGASAAALAVSFARRALGSASFIGTAER